MTPGAGREDADIPMPGAHDRASCSGFSRPLMTRAGALAQVDIDVARRRSVASDDAGLPVGRADIIDELGDGRRALFGEMRQRRGVFGDTERNIGGDSQRAGAGSGGRNRTSTR